MEISIYSILTWFVAILIGSLDLVVFLGSNKLSSRAFAFCIFWVTLWISTMGFFISFQNTDLGNIGLRTVYFLGSAISVSFLYFFLIFPDEIKLKRITYRSLIIFEILIFYLIYFTDLIVFGAYVNDSPSGWSWHFGILFFIYEISFLGFFLFGIITLYRKYKKCSDINLKNNLKFMLWVIIVGIIPPSLFCIAFPQFGYFDLDWLGPVTEIIWIPIMSYSIIRYRQMNVRAVVAEVLAIGMTIVFFINIFIQTPLGIWANMGTFVVFLILAIYLIRSILREAEQKELLNHLNNNLEQIVASQTLEIRKSYELEKKARRDLEKLNETKNQFIMITQHHLRTPVTSLRWELEAIGKGSYGKVSSDVAEALHDAKTATDRLTRIVDDFLSITALKAGGNILNIEKANIQPLLRDVFEE
ncbi:MAG: histidine kinase dimerization/phospho-acceptor domain-containing protein [Candidatus Paceibacterota bacterium]|jgi:hypothetical protein